jgi:hypothetical protein
MPTRSREIDRSSGRVSLRSLGAAGVPDNVRYLGQFGEHILTRSFTARDPFRTSSMSAFPGLPRIPRGAGNRAIENALITPPRTRRRSPNRPQGPQCVGLEIA